MSLYRLSMKRLMRCGTLRSMPLRWGMHSQEQWKYDRPFHFTRYSYVSSSPPGNSGRFRFRLRRFFRVSGSGGASTGGGGNTLRG